LLSKQVKSAKSKDAASDKKLKSSSANVSKARGKTGHNAKTSGKPVDAQKFELYFDFKAYINAIKPHQVCVCVCVCVCSFDVLVILDNLLTYLLTSCL